MPQASGSRHSIGFIEELVFGETPANPAFDALRHNSSTLNLSKASFGSNELRADRMVADHRGGTKSVAGNVVGELSLDSYDALIEAALGGDFALVGGVGPDMEAKAGILRKSFTLERYFEDIGQRLIYRGAQVNSMQLTMNTGGIVGLTFDIWAQSMEATVAAIAGATYNPATTTSPMDALSGSVLEGGVEIAVATEITLNLANNLNPRFVIGSDESLEPSIGRSIITGTMSAYFEDVTLYNKFINETASSLEVECGDGAGGLMTFIVPRLKYTGGDVPVADEGPVSMSMPFQGILDPVTGTSFIVRHN